MLAGPYPKGSKVGEHEEGGYENDEEENHATIAIALEPHDGGRALAASSKAERDPSIKREACELPRLVPEGTDQLCYILQGHLADHHCNLLLPNEWSVIGFFTHASTIFCPIIECPSDYAMLTCTRLHMCTAIASSVLFSGCVTTLWASMRVVLSLNEGSPSWQALGLLFP